MPIECQRNNLIYFSRHWNRLLLQIIWIHMVAFLKSRNGLTVSIHGSRVTMSSAAQRKQKQLSALGRSDLWLFVKIIQVTAIQRNQQPESQCIERSANTIEKVEFEFSYLLCKKPQTTCSVIGKLVSLSVC